jgi:hypothetical protein
MKLFTLFALIASTQAIRTSFDLPVKDKPSARPGDSRSTTRANFPGDSRSTTRANFPVGPTDGKTRGDILLEHVHGPPDKDNYPVYPYAQYSGFSNNTNTVEPPKDGLRFPYRNVI